MRRIHQLALASLLLGAAAPVAAQTITRDGSGGTAPITVNQATADVVVTSDGVIRATDVMANSAALDFQVTTSGSITNNGLIEHTGGGVGVFGRGTIRFVNTGTVNNGTVFSATPDTAVDFQNSGTLNGFVQMGQGTVVNSGTIDGNFSMTNGSFLNTGTITGNAGLSNANGVNRGSIAGNISMGSGSSTLTLGDGSFTGGNVSGGAGNDVLNLEGTGTLGGTVSLLQTINKTGGGTFTLGGSLPDDGTFNTIKLTTLPNLNIASASTLVLDGPVSYNVGTVTVTGGTLVVAAGESLTRLPNESTQAFISRQRYGRGVHNQDFSQTPQVTTIEQGGRVIVQAGGRYDVETLVMTGSSSAQIDGTANVFRSLSMTDGRLDIGATGKLFLDAGPAAAFSNVTTATASFVNSSINIAAGGVLGADLTFTSSVVNLNGTLDGDLTIGSGSTIGGSGTLNGDLSLQSGGTLAPGNSPGTLTVNGNATLMTGSTSRFELTNTAFDQLNATGTVALGGTLQLVALEPIRGNQTFRIITGAGGVTGQFDSSNVQTINTLTRSSGLRQGATFVEVFFGRNLYQPFANNQNQSAVAGNLDLYFTGTGTGLLPLTDALDNLTTRSQLAAAFDQLNPEVFDSEVQLPLIHAQQNAGQMEQYLAGVRNNMAPRLAGPATASTGAGTKVAAATPAIASGQIAQPVGSANGAINNTYYNPNKRDGGFVTGFSHQVDQNTIRDGVGGFQLSGFDAGSTGVLAGADRRISDNLTVGIAIGTGDVRADFDGGRGTLRGDQFQIGPYATWAHDDYYVDALATFNSYNFNSRRNVAFPGFSETLLGKNDVDTFSGYVGGGLRRRSGAYNWGPTLSLQYTNVEAGGLAETNGVSAVRINARETDSLRSQLGVRISRTYSTTPDRAIVPELRLRWAHEFSNDDTAIAAAFINGAGAFTVNASRPDRDSAYVGGSVNAYFDQKYNAFISYDADLGRQGANTDSVRGGLTVKF